MDFSDLRAELLATFKVEAEQHLATLDGGILALEGEGAERETVVQELFRAAHSLKGAARMVDLAAVERLAHAMEDLLGRLRDGVLEPGGEVVDLLLAATDGLREALAAGEAGEVPDVEPLVRALEAASRGEAFSVPRAAREAGSPPASPGDEGTPEAPPAPPAGPSSPTAAPGAGHIHVSAKAVDRLVETLAELAVSAQWVADPVRLLEQSDRRLRRLAAEVRAVLGDLPEGEAAANRLERLEEALSDWARELAAVRHGARRRAEEHLRLAREGREAAQALRMLPVTTLLDRLPRVVRDAARSCGKQVRLETAGGETALDREVLERLADPLLHLVRNAVDHGIESPEERRKAGKPEEGTVRVLARQRGGAVEVEVSDDGRGIDVERLVERAAAAGVADEESLASRPREELLQLVFTSGLSTAREVSALSGRGVGLDVVRANLERLQGRVEVSSEVGRGTVFTLSVPLTLANTFALVVRCGGAMLALPGTTVERVLRITPSELGTIEGKQVVELEGRPLPVVELAAVLGLPETPGRQMLHIVVAGVAERRLGLVVDELEETSELVVADLGPQVRGLATVAGGALLPDGRSAVVLDVAAVMDEATRSGAAPAVAGLEERRRRLRVLLADDSLTTRALEKIILEGAGFEVVTCGDGEVAWRTLRAEPVDTVVSDIQIPRLDGFGPTAHTHSNPRLRDLPVVLVTSLESPEDRARGLEAGADAYIVKRTFDQRELIETLKRLVGGPG